MWAAATTCSQLDNGNYDACKDEYAWAVAVGAISTIVCLICAIVLYAAANLLNDTGHMVVSIFLVLLWLPGVIWCTFDKPFASACATTARLNVGYGAYYGSHYAWALGGSANGYFGTWIAFLAAVKYMFASVPALEVPIKTAAGGRGLELFALFLFSIIEMSQASLDCGNHCSNILAWAVAVGVISAVICVLLFIPQLQPAAKYLLVFLVLLWFAAVGTLTFNYYEVSHVQNNAYLATRRRRAPVTYDSRRRAPGGCTPIATQSACSPKQRYCGCPTGMCPYEDTSTGSYVGCSCGTSQSDANTRNKRCPKGRRSMDFDGLPGPNEMNLPDPARRGTDSQRRGTTVDEWGIYASANNGFFSTWFAFFTSAHLCYTAWVGGGDTPDVKDPKVALLIIFFASVFEMWAAATLCSRLNDGYSSCQDEQAWAVAVGTISAFVCLVMGILFVFASGIAGQANKFVAVFLFVLWIFGTGVGTFDAPFHTACSEFANGYFSAWICFVLSFYYMYTSVPEIKEKVASNAPPAAGPVLCGCLLASLVVMVQSSVQCSDTYGGCTNVMAWAVACSVISIVACVVMLIPQAAPFIKFIAIFLAVLWFVGVATLTFTYKGSDAASLGIFASSGNGFFGTWIAFFCAIILCYVEAAGGKLDDIGAGTAVV